MIGVEMKTATLPEQPDTKLVYVGWVGDPPY